MKTQIQKKRRFRIYSAIVGFFSLLLAVGIATSNINFRSHLLVGRADNPSQYSITLDSSNRVTNSGDHVQHTKRGSEVTYTYAGVNSSTSGHVKLNDGGTLVNKDQITSLSAITAVFTGTGSLKARLAFANKSYSDYFDLVSGSRVETGSLPYYIELKASGGYVDIISALYEFTCVANPNAESHTTSGSYSVTFYTHTSDSNLDIGTSNSDMMSEVNTGSEYISSFSESSSKVFAGENGLKFGNRSNSGYVIINLNTSTVSETITTIDVASAQFGSDTGKLRVYVNGASTYSEITPSNGGSITVNANVTTLKFETSTKRAYLCGFTLVYNTASNPGQPANPPAYEIGFTADDTNKNSYTTNSVFDNDKNIVVTVNKSDGSYYTSTNYTYKVYNALDVEIDTSEKFPEIGVYTLVVTYGNYIPQQITLNVGEYVYAVDISAAMQKTTFATSDSLSTYISANLTATVEYSNGTRGESIPYSNFASNGIGVKLLTPRGINYDITTPFGTDGVWTIKVYDINDETMFYNVSITVEPILVQTISLDKATKELEVGDSFKLVASVGPSDATNKAISWSSNNESVATVDDEGLVTAVAVGGATITAATADGSNLYGTCAVTVIAKTATVDDTLTQATTGVSQNANSVTYSTFTNRTNSLDGINSNAVYAGQSASPGTGQTGSGSIQLRSNGSNSGIVTTSSGGKIRKVAVVWNSATLDTRTLNVYGNNSAYDDATDLYYSNYQGTLLGTIVKGTSTELTITGDYTYVGVRSAASALYLDSITFTWGGAGSGGSAATQVYPTSISLSGTSTISIGETSQLSVNYSPATTNVKNVTFSSSNTSVATVSSEGLVTGVAQGSSTITATAQATNGTVSTTLGITVTSISVTSVVLDSNSATVKAGKTVTLVATVYPTNATNRNVTWSSNNTSVATVSNAGVVNGISAGEATITVTTVDGSKKATCVVTVTSAAASGYYEDIINNAATVSDLGNTATSAWKDFTITLSSGAAYTIHSMGTKGNSNALQWNTNGYLYSTTSGGNISGVSAELASGKSIDVYASTTAFSSNSGGTFIGTITGSDSLTVDGSYEYIRIKGGTSGTAISSITIEYGTPTPTDPTSIIMSPTSVELAPNGTKQLTVSYVPSNANQNKDVTWSSSNTNVATVSSSGLVTVKSSASAGQSATITATLTNLTSIKATCKVDVVEQANDDHTVLIYLCGADLESNNGLATGDLQEILSVSGQPDDVNIVIETGGATSWRSTYGISSSKLERWHVENRSLVKDSSLTYASMGLASTLQEFIEYGLTNYPADRTGLILWNHGGAMRGVCYDEKKSSDSLLNSEVKTAVSGALSNCGMSGQKLEWIGYDACLMQVQDVAEFNSQYFNYMIASEESESGYGWDYDTWVDDLYAKSSTTTILKAVVDGFIKSNGGTNSTSNDQTLSYLNLSYMSAYKTAWETMASTIKSMIGSYGKSNFQTLMKTCKYYGTDDDSEGYSYFGIFDAKDVLNKLLGTSAFSGATTQINNAITAFNNLVAYSSCGKGAGNSNGLCCFFPMKDGSGYTCQTSKYYKASETNFSNWLSVVTSYGD